MTHDPTFWIIARSSGLVAYGLLTASVLLGIVLKGRPFGRSVKPAAITDVHRFAAILGLIAIAIHGTSLVLDRTISITPLALLVPGLIPYRPLWTSLGVIAAEAMLLVYVSFSQRKRIGAKAWRRLHWTTYAIFALATLHGVAAGTDTSRPWALPMYGAAVGAVLVNRIEIDRALCIGYGACADAAPRSLRLAADGKVEAVADVVDDDDVFEAESVCPMSALTAYAVRRRDAA